MILPKAFQSLQSFVGRSLLCLPRDPDHLLQADLEHEHLLHDEEHPRHRATGPLNVRSHIGQVQLQENNTFFRSILAS